MNDGPGADAERLRTRLRWQNLARRPRATDRRVALLASFTIDPLVPYLGTALADAGIPADVWVGPYNQIERQCLDDDSETARFAPQTVVVAPRLEELWAGRRLPLDEPADGYEADLTYLADACVGAARRWEAELVFVLPAVPETRPAGVGDDGNVTGVAATATAVREALRRRLAGAEGVRVVDADVLMRTVGSRNAYRPALLAAAQIPFSEEYFDLLARRIGRLVAAYRRAGGPLIVLDAAAVLPAGEVARSRQPATAAGDRDTNSPFTSLEPYLAETARLGASVALCNATDASYARLAATVPVAAWRAGGPACAEQVRELAEQLSTRLDQVAFLSTRAAAVAEVERDLPGVAVLPLPADRERWAPALNDSPLVDQVPPARTVPATAGGAASTRPALSLESFLANLRLTVEFTPLSVETGELAEDLTRRVAEFHLNGEVWPAERFTDHLGGGAHVCLGVHVRDRFGDHGLCGVVVAHAEGPALVVDLWVLTCPVLGKGVEGRVLSRLAEVARARGCDTVVFQYHPTSRNEACHRFLADVAPASMPKDHAAAVAIPLPFLERRAAPASIPPSAPGAGAVTGHDPRPRRRPAVGNAMTGRFTTASQILRAVESSGGRAARTPGVDEGAPPRTETERLLADIFAAVLRSPTRGMERNFFASGDSMLAVQLIAKANQAGLRVTLRQVFQHQTVAALAAVVTPVRHRDGDDLAVTGPTVTGPAPLLPLQAWFFGLDLPRPDHFNQSQRFEVPADVDVAALERAVASLLEHHQALRMRFLATEGGWRQVDSGTPRAAPFTHVDLRGTPPEEWDAAVATHETGLQVNMSPADGRLIQFALYTFDPGRPPQLLVILHHLAIDGISWRIVLEDLQEAYHQARHGGSVQLAPVATPVLAWARRLHEFAQTEEVRAELPSWLAESRAQVAPLSRDKPDVGNRGMLTHVQGTLFSADETRALRERAVGVDRVSVDILLIAAMTRTLARWTGGRRFLVDVVNHGRESYIDGIDLSRTVGWLVMNVPVLFEADAEQPLDELVPATNRQLRAWSSHHGGGDNLLRFLSEDEMVRKRLAALPGADILFSYAGHVDPGAVEHPLLGRQIDGPGQDMDAGASAPYALQFDTIILGDRIRLEIGYRETQYHASTIETLLDGWASELRTLAATVRSPLDGRS